MTNQRNGSVVIQLADVSKYYGNIRALSGINLTVRRGEVTCVLGDNGAGKSTLIKIISGIHPHDGGVMRLHGKDVRFASPRKALDAGIATVYQDLALVDQLTVYQNMFLKRETVRGPLVNNKAMREVARAHLDEMSINIPSVDVPVARLSGGQRQAIAIARAVYSEAKILLLDEPLAAMGAKEAAIILDLVRDLKQRGDVSIIIIAHNYGQVLEICDRINLLQHGEITFDKPSKDTSVQELTDIVIEEYRRALLERQRTA